MFLDSWLSQRYALCCKQGYTDHDLDVPGANAPRKAIQYFLLTTVPTDVLMLTYGYSTITYR
jgi:hypothetical protein